MDEYVAAEEGFKRGYEKGYADGKKHAEDEIIILKQKRVNIFETLDAYERGRVNALKWIPVTERLPEAGQYVLVCDTREDYVGVWEFWDCVWRDASYQTWGLNEVTRWMPLPEPPEAEPSKITEQTLNALNRMGAAVHG